MAARRASATKKTAKRRAPARGRKPRAAAPARKTARKRTARPVRRSAAKRVAAPAFAPQKSGASEKDLVVFEIQRARVAVMAAIQGLGAGTAMRPVAQGKWSIREIVLHLAVRDRVRLDEFESLRAGSAASWSHITDAAGHAKLNEAHLAPLRALGWDEALRLLSTTRDELMAALQAVPAEPAEVWSAAHPFGACMRKLVPHDRKHAEAIKNARIAG